VHEGALDAWSGDVVHKIIVDVDPVPKSRNVQDHCCVVRKRKEVADIPVGFKFVFGTKMRLWMNRLLVNWLLMKGLRAYNCN
jgi:hypothetical protein